MPIEIHILSGSRQGEQLRLDGEDVGVGDSAECQVRFPSDSQPAVRGRKASLRLNQDGWQFRNQGLGEWFVNHSAVPPQGTSPLRSGDIVRLSASGPDFLFSIVSSRRPASAAAAPASGSSSPTNTRPVPTSSPPAAVVNNSTTNQPADETPAPALSLASGSNANVTVAMNLPLPIVIAGGGVVLVTLVVLAMLLRSGTANTPVASGVVGNTPTSTTPATDPIQTTSIEPIKLQPPSVPMPAPSPKLGPTPPVKLSADQLVEKFGGAVVWIGFEENNGQKLPLSTGWAVTPNTVVTTAACVADLKELKNDGHRVFVAHGQSASQMIAITNLRTHPRYAEKDGDGRSSLFHNIGMVTLESPLPVHCDLLPSAKLPKPVVGIEVTVLGYPVTKQNYKPFDTLNPPVLVRGSGRIKDTRPLAGMPLLVLDVPGAAGINGAPVFESSGKVIGLMWHLGESSHAVPHVVLADYIQELLP